MRAFLDDPAAVHDDDPVGRAHGREAVGDDDRRAVLHQPVEGVLDQALAFGVERGGRFVEQQQGRVAQQRAGDRDALALPAREARSAFAHESIEPFAEARAGNPRHWRRARPATSGLRCASQLP